MKGKPRPVEEVAQEQYDKQARLVERLENRLNKAEQEIRALRVDLSNEKEILAYYKSHPALRKTIQEQIPQLFTIEDQYSQVREHMDRVTRDTEAEVKK